ncbi:MAG: hypothetical protein ACYC0V_06845 [Armatimonadota bacterium]
MTAKELKEIGIYAAVTMIFTVGLFTAQSAISTESNNRNAPRMVINGMTASTVVLPGKRPGTVEVKLNVTNPEKKNRNVNLNLNLVRIDFAGNPLSRVPTPSDQKRTVESVRRIHGTIKGGGTTEFKWVWNVGSRKPASTVRSGSFSSYAIEWQKDKIEKGKTPGKNLISFPANLAQGMNLARK